MLAAQNGHLEVVRLLLDKISNVNQDNKVPVCVCARARACLAARRGLATPRLARCPKTTGVSQAGPRAQFLGLAVN